MNLTFSSGIVLGAMALSTAVFAAGPRTDEVVQRDVNQQQRIEQGLSSGELTTREAARLERGETRIERTEARGLRDGSLTAGEQARINRLENRESGAIYRQKHDAQTGDPASASSQRMQGAVQRNLDQQARIEKGATNGSLTNREVGRLERGQAHVSRREARVGANGQVSAGEGVRLQRAQNRQSRHIFRQKHD
jgi:hypothetical protein